MKLKYAAAFAGLLTGGLLAAFSSPAQAFSFTTNFTPSLTGSNASKGNIWLNSVMLGDGTSISDFALVSSANLLYNDAYTGGNTGAASSDLGDKATVGIKKESATSSSIVTSLGNLNLNSIIDTEDTGSFKMNLSFSSAIDNLFFWERGMNSKLQVQALDAAGNLIGNLLTLNSATWNYAGFGIDTTEINETQRVGSLGVSLKDLGVSGPIAGIQLVSNRSFNGPDFKVVGSAASVPEPASLAGLGLIAGALVVSRRRKLA